MRIVVVAAVADGIQVSDAAYIGLNSTNAPCIVEIACDFRPIFVIDSYHVTEEILFVEIRIVYASCIHTCAVKESNGRTRIVVQEHHHVLDIILCPCFRYDTATIENILVLDTVYRFARADALGVVGVGEGARATTL